MSLPTYQEYKDSGVPLLGDIPEHWSVFCIRRSLLEHRQGYYSTDEYQDSGIRLLRITDLNTDGSACYESSPFVESKADVIPFLLQDNDFVFARTGGAGSFALMKNLCDTEPVAYASYLIRFRFNNQISSEFLKYQFLSRCFEQGIAKSIHGGVNKNIHAEDIKNQFVTCPPIGEQTAIATFLDRETAKIDALIAEQEKLLTLLTEKRQATISHAVTKGLNPDAPMKDSGVAWLGEVPAHWEVGCLKRFAEVFDCKHHTVQFLDVGLPIVSIRELAGNRIDISEAKLTSKQEWDFLREGRVPQHGDLVFCRNASVGAVGYVEVNQSEFCMGQDVCLIRPSVLDKFMYFQLTGESVSKQIEALLVGATIRRANVEEIRNLYICYPPQNEQVRVSEFLETELASLDALTTEATRSITLLKERRTALISAAVTGKIDVRGLVTEAEAA